MITDTRSRAAGTRPPVGLGAIEVCVAAALADVAAVVCLLLRFLPMGGLTTVLAAFPFAVLGDRQRLRSCVAATVSGCVTGFLLAGPVTANAVGVAAVLGSLLGIAHRRGWSWIQTMLTGALALGLPAAILTVTGMWVFAAYRELAFAQLSNSWHGVARIAGAIPLRPITALVQMGDASVSSVLDYWWVWTPAAMVIAVAMLTAVARLLFRRPLGMVARLAPVAVPALGCLEAADVRVDPLPLRFTKVSARYPGAAAPVLSQLDFSLERGEFVTVTGHNGAGKSTLGRLIAGTPPDSGDVERPGAAGLGAPAGTAIVFQRPECQVLGVRVVDDLVWGARSGSPVDIDGLLDRVGLTGMALCETATLSGGQLQRLAVAAMLARDPSVVVSDESTAMLDPDGRALMLRLLRSLAHREHKAVVHITHHLNEITGSDRTVCLDDPAADPRHSTETAMAHPQPAGAGEGLPGGVVEVRGLGFVHASGTPWEHRVLSGVDLNVRAGGGLLITGANGAGKSTLATLLAGLAAPTEGWARLDGRPVRNGRDGALLALQHPRLQLLRATVVQDIRDAGVVSADRADEVLALLGLSPTLYRNRGIDDLSVGEQRRVALAGLLSRRPRLLVLDEPLAGLDDDGQKALLRALEAAREAGTTLIMTSHDITGLARVIDHAMTLENGRVQTPHRPSSRADASQPPPRGPAPKAATRPRTPKTRPAIPTVLTPRTLPWSSPAHRLWAGTKIAILGLVSIVLAADPSWSTVLAAATVLSTWIRIAQVPRSIRPRVPRWLVLAALVSAALAGASGGAPYLMIHGVSFGAGGVLHWARFAAVTALTLLGALLFIWTTALTDIPPLLQRIADIGGPHSWLPVKQWTTTISLGLRLLPILREECAVVLKMTSQRVDSGPVRRSEAVRNRRDQVVHGIVLCCATAVRRSGEMGDAITARGGLGTVAHIDRQPGRWDALALLGAVAVLTAGILA